MKLYIMIVLSLLFLCNITIAQTYANFPESKHILVVYNNDDDTSKLIKDYYVQLRNIPAETNVLPLNDLDVSDTVSFPSGNVWMDEYKEDYVSENNKAAWECYVDRIATPIENYLSTTYSEGELLKNTIRYIVLCKGIPMKLWAYIDFDTYLNPSWFNKLNVSIDALVCLLYNPVINLYNSSASLANPYKNQADMTFTFNKRFITNYFHTGNWYLNYLVTRLDGNSYEDVIAMIDRAADPEYSGNSWWIIDADTCHNTSVTKAVDNWNLMSNALNRLSYNGFNTNPMEYNTDCDFILDNSVGLNEPVMGYTSCGRHSWMLLCNPEHDPAYIQLCLVFDYADGAIFNTFESYNGYSMHIQNRYQDYGMISEFIKMGGTGGVAHTWEPQLGGAALNDNLFNLYEMGYSFADAAYQSIPFMAWNNIVIGDPLTAIAWGKQTTTHYLEMKNTNLVTDTIHISAGDTVFFASYSNIKLKYHGFVFSNESSVLTLGNNVTLSSDSWDRGLLLADSHDYPQLIWCENPSMSPISYYKIFRKFDSGNWTLVDSLTGNTWIDSSLTFKKGTGTYHDSVYYYVKSYNSTSSSDPSNTVAAKLGTTVAVSLYNGWQIVSVPVIPENYSASSVFPTHVGTIYSYVPGSGYVPADPLQNGLGYWADFSPAQTVYHSGLALDTLDVSVPNGWSFLGSVSYNVRASEICQQPSGIITSLYKYDPAHGYVLIPDGGYIEPGIGYWMHTSQSGHVILSESCGGLQKGTSLSEINLADLDKFTLTDSLGQQQSLYVANIDIDSTLESFDRSMPPPMPVLGFDARFNSGEFIRVVSADSGLVDLQMDIESIAYPVTLSWEINPENGIQYSFINDSTLGKMTSLVENNGLTEFSKDSKGKIRLFGKVNEFFKSSQIPKQFALFQNYPNPFNPTTTIKYSIVKDGFVILDIYNVLGEKVNELVNQLQKAGIYEVAFDATRLSSGVYFYKITSGEYSATRKMMLIK